jgi:hypothetical protein
MASAARKQDREESTPPDKLRTAFVKPKRLISLRTKPTSTLRVTSALSSNLDAMSKANPPSVTARL